MNFKFLPKSYKLFISKIVSNIYQILNFDHCDPFNYLYQNSIIRNPSKIIFKNTIAVEHYASSDNFDHNNDYCYLILIQFT